MCGQTPDQLQLRQLGIQGLGLVSPLHHHWIICVSGSGKTKQQEQDTEHNCPSCRYGVVFQGFQASPLLPSVAQVWAQLTPCDDELADLSLYTKFMSRQPATACPSTERVSMVQTFVKRSPSAQNKDSHQKDRRRGLLSPPGRRRGYFCPRVK
jgi:hypothetical protein